MTIVWRAGRSILCLSTDTKPAERDGYTLKEEDTGRSFLRVNGAWVQTGGAAHNHPESDVTSLVTHLTGKEPANVNIQTHVTSVHAPSNAQKNSDITKAEIEAKLTGELTSHTHAGGSGNAWTTKVKTADQTNNTAVLVDDNTLQFNTVANTQYTIRLLAFFVTNATADSKYRLIHTGTTTRVRRKVRRTATTDILQTVELKTAFDSADVVLSTTGLNPWVEEDIILQVGATAGVVKFQWAQVTLNAGPTNCLEGSYLEYALS